MKTELNLDVHHLTRVEGHGNIKIRIEKGKIKEARWDVVETPRFFEAMLQGKHYTSAAILTSRICGICSIGHSLASLRATERAFGIEIPEVAKKLRMLAKHGETLQSHVLHLFFLVAPDLFNLPDAISLLEKEKKIYALTNRLKNLAAHLYNNVVDNKPFPHKGNALIQDQNINSQGLQDELESALLGVAETVAPEMTGLPSAKPFIYSQPGLVNIARRLKSLGNKICDVVAGRATHPVSLQVGGVAVAPNKNRLLELREDLKNSLNDLTTTVEIFKTLKLVDFVRETEFVSLKGGNKYPFIGGDLISSDGIQKREDQYLEMTNEFVDKNNTSKWCKLSRESFAVGALARLNNNYNLLHPEAQKVSSALGLKPLCHNPYLNNVAQLVECVHVVHESIGLIDDLLDDTLTETILPVEPKAGEGVGAVEVPRGILYHHYQYDDKGYIIKANCIIPTTQNNLNIHLDLKELVSQFLPHEIDDKKMELLCSMLVRAYDPCISCSVH